MEAPTILDMISRISLQENGEEYDHEKFMNTMYRILGMNIPEMTHTYCESIAKLLEKEGFSYETAYAHYFSKMFDHVLSGFSQEQIEKNILS